MEQCAEFFPDIGITRPRVKMKEPEARKETLMSYLDTLAGRPSASWNHYRIQIGMVGVSLTLGATRRGTWSPHGRTADQARRRAVLAYLGE
jgi:hypothetical protein